MKQECWSCENWNGHACKITACNKHYPNNIFFDEFMCCKTIVFPMIISGKTFNTWQEIVDYICMHEDERYGIG